MPSTGPLAGVRVIIAGAGMSGLVAARELANRGARVDVYEARDRIGGRVHTIRGGVMGPLHVEAGGEFIDAEHRRVHRLARELGVRLAPILRRGFGTAIRYDGRLHVSSTQTAGWREIGRLLAPAVEAHRAHGGEWRGSIAAALGRLTLADILRQRRGSTRALGFSQALRGFFVADATELSALVAVDQLLEGNPGAVRLSRVVGGAGRLADALAQDRRFRIHLSHVLRRVVYDPGGVRVSIEAPDGTRTERDAAFAVLTLPPPILCQLEFSPPVPAAARRAFQTVPLGCGTKTLLRFAEPWWRRARRPNAFGTNLDVCAIWESAEEQRGGAALTLFAGGSASARMQELGQNGPGPLVRRLRWMGRPTPVLGYTQVAWERDPWAKGAYAIFTPRFDPNDRALLGRGVGRVLFAGEHTSRDAQGYIEGAVESGERVAAEVESLVRLGSAGAR